MRGLNKIAMGVEGVVSAVTRLACEVDRRVVVSSLGAEAFSEVVAVGVSNLSVARFGEVMERIRDQKTFIGGYENVKSFDWSSFVEDISRLAVKASQARVPPPGTYRAVIDNHLIGLMLREAFGHAFEGDYVMYKSSVLCGRLGTKVASDLVAIIDDGLTEGATQRLLMMRKASWRIMVQVMPREVARFIQSRFGELRISEARYEGLAK